MQRFLYLLRHAQSAVKQIGQRDIDRELTPFGEQQAASVATIFRTKKTLPQLVYSSSAKRAHSTAIHLTRTLDLDPDKIILKNELYEAPLDAYLDLLSELPDEAQHVLIVAHNPGISYFASYVTKQNLPEMVPAAMVMVRSSAETWSKILDDVSELEGFYTPGTTQGLRLNEM